MAAVRLVAPIASLLLVGRLPSFAVPLLTGLTSSLTIGAFSLAPPLSRRRGGGGGRRCASSRFSIQRPSVLSSIADADGAPSAAIAGNAIEAEEGQRKSLTASLVSHHVAIKTRDVETAIDFYSLLGFGVEAKFKAGPARAAWLIHGGVGENAEEPDFVAAPSASTRIELLEVPSRMLDEPEGMKRRAVDLTKREELLGLNHLALDVTRCVRRPSPKDGDDGIETGGGSSSSCSLYNLQEFLDDLNTESVSKFGKTLNVALNPTKRIIGRDVYEMAFLFDADGALVELLNYSGRLEQDVGDGWTPWDGKGFIQ